MEVAEGIDVDDASLDLGAAARDHGRRELDHRVDGGPGLGGARARGEAAGRRREDVTPVEEVGLTGSRRNAGASIR